MIILAHDGSLCSDWVARYALRFAARDPDRRLLVLHVRDDSVAPAVADARLNLLAEACRTAGIACRQEILPLQGSTFHSLARALPDDPAGLLLCGTRIRPRRQRFLAGSVAAGLLEAHRGPTLALRVVQPGLLGEPHEVLISLPPRGDPLPWLPLLLDRFAGSLRRATLLHLLTVGPLSQAQRTPGARAAMRRTGEQALVQLAAALASQLQPPVPVIGHRVAITGDWPHQLLVEASRLKCQLLLVAGDRSALSSFTAHSQGLERVLAGAPCDIGLYSRP